MQKIPSVVLKSSFQKQEAQVDWTIDDWKAICGVQGTCESLRFTLPNSNITCNMLLNITPTEKQVYVIIVHHEASFLHPQLQMSIVLPTNKLYDLGNEVMPTLSPQCVSSMVPSKLVNIARCFNLPQYDLMQFVHPDGSFTFKCHVKYTTAALNNCASSCANGIGFPKPHETKFILKDYSGLYERQLMCDVVLVTAGEKQLKAHMVILAMVSPYFFAMFRLEDPTKTSPRIINLSSNTNLTLEVCQGFLDYLYGLKSVSDLKNIVMELFMLADKFGIPMLRQACETFLCDDLTHANVAKLLLFSHKNDCIFLKRKAVTVARSNMEIIKKSSEFDKIFEDKDLMLLIL